MTVGGERSRQRWDVLGLGAVTVDDLLYVDGYPGPDTKVEIAGERRAGGGLVATALVAVARVGGRGAYLGALGHDELSDFVAAHLERAGVDCSRVIRVDGARPIHSRIIVDRLTGERTILYTTAGVRDVRIDEIDPDDVAASRVVLVDSTVTATALELVEVAHWVGVPVVADLEGRRPRAADLAGVVDHLVVGRSFAAWLSGEERPEAAAAALWRPGLAACVVTAGDRGCWFRALETAGEVRHEPAPVVRAVDTNGCGDVFHGAYAARIAAGDRVAEAVRIATRMAAAKATRPSGWDGVPAWSPGEAEPTWDDDQAPGGTAASAAGMDPGGAGAPARTTTIAADGDRMGGAADPHRADLPAGR